METGTCWEVWSRRGKRGAFLWARYIDRGDALHAARGLNSYLVPEWNPNREGEPFDVVCIYEAPIGDLPVDAPFLV
jgi:hypothetical protein